MEELEYISTSPDLQAVKRAVKPEDEANLPALKRCLIKLDSWIEQYNSNESLTVDESIFTVKEQLAINQRSVLMAKELKQLLETTINDIKEKYEDG